MLQCVNIICINSNIVGVPPRVMPDAPTGFPDSIDSTLVEGIARVVGVDGAVAWLEPEQGGTCAHCASSAACGSKGLGTLANRLEARRFPITGHPDLAVGDRVVVGVRGDALVKAALLTYALPLVLLFTAGGLAQWVAGSDAMTLAASVCGLLLGLGATKIGAGRLFGRGGGAPRLLRRLGSGQACHLG